ncbi:MAG: phenylalanine--tRNA ligase subunit beta [Bacteroidales bacterium]|jgi:phenylalanyl-tRNA synthetase beta chain|nr:phenylalanine--tRNA ligase subunit beta [Bacteroidales bacterium]
MNISYNWLKNYIEISETPEELSEILTQLGLEVGGIENFSSVKGGLKGFVTGKVLTCEKHPNADKLKITTVDTGDSEPLNIVCGAPNVAAGQKVVVATVGTIIYNDQGSFEIKKSKIRGEISEGMICAEDEMGIGTSHAGILVLPEDTKTGVPASEYFKIENDFVLEVDITANHIDAASHIGVARDLAAYKNINYKFPALRNLKKYSNNFNVDVEIKNTEACPRYMGICMDNVKVSESPEWLKNKLKAIGLTPINNIVDIANYVLHETGHPLHAFDGDKITGNKIIIKPAEENSKFTTLDNIERTLSDKDLMICNEKDPMCIAGVFGGLDSGISDNTKKIFIESAYFNPVWVRKTAKRHTINTDSSFRFERGADINMAPYALKRAASLIEELGFGTVSSDIIDIYPNKKELEKIEFSFDKFTKLVGKNIHRDIIKRIINSLEINILKEEGDLLLLEIPSYRVDVTSFADVVEDILRIYGYNNIEVPEKISISINNENKNNNEKLVNIISNQLVSCGFNEIMCNSLTGAHIFTDKDNMPEDVVKLCNPLSNDLSIMRPGLLSGGLESIEHNIKRKNHDLKLFEFGRSYHYNPQKNISDINAYSEKRTLGIWITGKKNPLSWNLKDSPSDYFYLKSYVTNVLKKLGIDLDSLKFEILSNDVFSYYQSFEHNDNEILKIGSVSSLLLKKYDIQQDVFYSELNWSNILKIVNNEIRYIPVSKFPKVKRDLALLIDKSISYKTLTDLAFATESKLLTEISLFDVYDGKNIEKGKISYALSFILEDTGKTMTDNQIDKIMKKLISAFEKELDASIR